MDGKGRWVDNVFVERSPSVRIVVCVLGHHLVAGSGPRAVLLSLSDHGSLQPQDRCLRDP